MIPKKAYLSLRKKNPEIIVKYYGGPDVTFTLPCSKTEANRVLELINTQITYGTFRLSDYSRKLSNISLERFSKLWINYRQQQRRLNHISASTLEHDVYTLKTFTETVGPNTKIIDITPERIVNDFIERLLGGQTQHGRPFKPITVNSYLKNLQTAFNWAIEKNYIFINPFLKVKKLKVKSEIRILTPEEIRRFREYLKDRPSWQLDAFNFALWTGCRLQSIVQLHKDHFVTLAVGGEVHKFIELTEKGNKTRLVPLLPEPEALLNHRISQMGNAESERAREGFIFWEVSYKDSPSWAIRKASTALGIERANFHCLRKTFATYALEQGLSLETIQHILGHSDFRVTQLSYSKTTLFKVASEMKKLDAL